MGGAFVFRARFFSKNMHAVTARLHGSCGMSEIRNYYVNWNGLMIQSSLDLWSKVSPGEAKNTPVQLLIRNCGNC